MAKLTLPTISAQYASVAQINQAYRDIETAFENTVSRDGTTPNTMSADLDLNSNDLLNVNVLYAADLQVNGYDSINTILDAATASETNAAASASAAATSEANAAASAAAAATFDPALFVEKAGGTMTGQLKGITPVAAEDLARKDYVDTKVDGADVVLRDGSQSMTGDLDITKLLPSLNLSHTGASDSEINHVSSAVQRAKLKFNNITGHYEIQVYSVGGVLLHTWYFKANGNLALGGSATPTATDDLTNKGYVDAAVLAGAPKVLVQDRKPDTIAGGGNAAGVNVRVLNSAPINEITGFSLASNQITLPAGTYYIKGRAPCYKIDRTVCDFYNVTDGTLAIQGENCYAANSGSTQIDATFEGTITIAATKTFEVRHWTQTVRATNGLGIDIGSSYTTRNLQEIYTSVWIYQLAEG